MSIMDDEFEEPSEGFKLALFCINACNGDLEKARKLAAINGYGFPHDDWYDALATWEDTGTEDVRTAINLLDAANGQLEEAKENAKKQGIKFALWQWAEAEERWEYEQQVKEWFKWAQKKITKRQLDPDTLLALAYIQELSGDFEKAVNVATERGHQFGVVQWADAWKMWEEGREWLVQSAMEWLLICDGCVDDAREKAARSSVALPTDIWGEAQRRWVEYKTALQSKSETNGKET